MAGVMNMSSKSMPMDKSKGFQGPMSEMCKNMEKCKDVKGGSKAKKKNCPKC
jgi:hypothetical protein